MGVTLLSVIHDRYEAEGGKSTGEMMDEERQAAGELGDIGFGYRPRAPFLVVMLGVVPSIYNRGNILLIQPVN
jgi:hypothetical protein